MAVVSGSVVVGGDLCRYKIGTKLAGVSLVGKQAC